MASWGLDLWLETTVELVQTKVLALSSQLTFSFSPISDFTSLVTLWKRPFPPFFDATLFSSSISKIMH